MVKQVRKFFIVFFVYLVLEGALRKWVFPAFSTELFLFKDLLVVGALFGFLGNSSSLRGEDPSFLTGSENLLLWGWFFLFCGYFFVSGVSLSSIAGLRYYLIMLPLVLLTPQVIADTADLNRLAARYLWLALAVSILGVAQFFSPPDALINRYAWAVAVMDVSTFGEGMTRITGTFSYITPYAVYLQFMFLLALALFVQSDRGKQRMLWGVAIALLFVNIVMTGSRAPLLISVVLAIPFLLSVLQEIYTIKGRVLPIMATLVIMGLLLFQFSDVFSMLSERNREARDERERIAGALMVPVVTLRDAEFVGAGVGSTFMGVRELGRSSEGAGFDEVNSDRIGVEVGIFGYLFVLIFKLVFLWKAWGLYRSATDRAIKTWALVVFAYQLSLLWSIPVYNSVAAAFYFASLGLYVFLRRQDTMMCAAASRQEVRIA